MASGKEDELLDVFTWTDVSYTLDHFVNDFPLPQVVKVIRGHDGGEGGGTVGYGEILTLHAIRESRVFHAQDANANPFALSGEFQHRFWILPNEKDCPPDSLRIFDIPKYHPKFKYLEAMEAHYGEKEDMDTADTGEIFEILKIENGSKQEKVVHVLNVETRRHATFTSKCTATFRPLLDSKKHQLSDLKNLPFNFPIRIYFMEDDEDANTVDVLSPLKKSVDLRVTKEVTDVTIIATTVSSDPDLKLCFEIGKDLEIMFVVAEGFKDGARHYTDVVNTLNCRFDVLKFMNEHQLPLVRCRKAITQFDYDTIKKFIIDKSISLPTFDDNPLDEVDAPILPPRRKYIEKKDDSGAVLLGVRKLQLDVTPGMQDHITSNFNLNDPANDPAIVNEDKKAQVDELHKNIVYDTANDPPYPTMTPNHPTNPQVTTPTTKERIHGLLRTFHDSVPNSVPNPVVLPRPARRSTMDDVTKNNIPGNPAQNEVTKRNIPIITPRRISRSKKDMNPPVKDPNDPPAVPEDPIVIPESKSSQLDVTDIDVSEQDDTQIYANIDGSITRENMETNRPPLPPKLAGLSKNRSVTEEELLPSELSELPTLQKENPDTEEEEPTSENIYQIPNQLLSSESPSLTRDFGLSRPRGDSDGTQSNVVTSLPVVPIAPRVSSAPKLISTIPLDLSTLSVVDVADVLWDLNMGQYSEIFKEELIDGRLLMKLTESDLDSFNMTTIHRTKLLNFIKGWRPKMTAMRLSSA